MGHTTIREPVCHRAFLPTPVSAITAGSGTVIAVMIASGTLQMNIAMLVPVGSMIIANAMNACAGLNRENVKSLKRPAACEMNSFLTM